MKHGTNVSQCEPPRTGWGAAGATGHGSNVVITGEEIDDALQRCVLCGGPLRDDDGHRSLAAVGLPDQGGVVNARNGRTGAAIDGMLREMHARQPIVQGSWYQNGDGALQWQPGGDLEPLWGSDTALRDRHGKHVYIDTDGTQVVESDIELVSPTMTNERVERAIEIATAVVRNRGGADDDAAEVERAIRVAYQCGRDDQEGR